MYCFPFKQHCICDGDLLILTVLVMWFLLLATFYTSTAGHAYLWSRCDLYHLWRFLFAHTFGSGPIAVAAFRIELIAQTLTGESLAISSVPQKHSSTCANPSSARNTWRNGQSIRSRARRSLQTPFHGLITYRKYHLSAESKHSPISSRSPSKWFNGRPWKTRPLCPYFLLAPL